MLLDVVAMPLHYSCIDSRTIDQDVLAVLVQALKVVKIIEL